MTRPWQLKGAAQGAKSWANIPGAYYATREAAEQAAPSQIKKHCLERIALFYRPDTNNSLRRIWDAKPKMPDTPTKKIKASVTNAQDVLDLLEKYPDVKPEDITFTDGYYEGTMAVYEWPQCEARLRLGKEPELRCELEAKHCGCHKVGDTEWSKA